MEALGVGAAVRKLTVDNLSKALHVATTDEKQISRARLLGEEIRQVSLIHFDNLATSDIPFRRTALGQPSR